MKRIVTYVLLFCMLTGLTACGKKTEETDSKISRPKVELEKKEEEKEQAKKTEVTVLDLDKSDSFSMEWDADVSKMLLYCKYTSVTMSEETAVKYPEMAEILAQTARMQMNAMETEVDNLTAWAKEANPGSEYFEPLVSTVDVQVRRADSVAVSLLYDSFSDYGRIEDYRGMHGSNYDTVTGQELKVSDVISDMSKIPELVKAELNSHMWTGDLYSESTVQDYFRDTPEDGISWTLDYNGVTFYFAAGELAEEGFGRLSATVLFEGNEELFREKYMEVPEAYMVRLPMNHSFFADTDRDGANEELLVSGYLGEDGRYYTDLGIYTDTDAVYYYEEMFAYDLYPYYVKTAEDEHYLYVFCKDDELWDAQMHLIVFGIEEGGISKLGERLSGPYFKPDEENGLTRYAVPTNPERFYLDFGTAYRVGEKGMPFALAEAPSVYVESAEELLEAIEPGASIILGAGDYNLSEYMEKVWAQEGEAWNQAHPYAQLRETVDGVELVIQDVEDLVLTGGTENAEDTLVVTDPRYGTVMNFEFCRNLYLENLTMGHTERGDCEGNVLNFFNCETINLSGMDLYGCGVYGIGARDSYNLLVYDSVIGDCSYGPFDISECYGNLIFRNCTMVNSEGYPYYMDMGETLLAFYDCVFGENETQYIYFLEEAWKENCTFQDIEEYPEYGYDVEADPEMSFDPEIMDMIYIDEEAVGFTEWSGYQEVNPESGAAFYFPYTDPYTDQMVDLSLSINEDGSGWLEYGEELWDFTWYCSDDCTVCFVLEDGWNLYGNIFVNPNVENSTWWMMLQMGERILWLY